MGLKVAVFVFCRCEHSQRRMPAPGVVEQFDVVVDRRDELDPGLQRLAVEELGLHAGPERLDDRVVVGTSHGPDRRCDAQVMDFLVKRRRR